MLTSLRTAAPEGPVETDVAIIGAGLAGLVLAKTLVELGLLVVVVESGGEQQIEEVHPLNEVEMTAQQYLGATKGRFRALGGTSTRWGGALLPYLEGDFKDHPCGWHSGWSVDVAEIEPYLAPLEHDFGVAAGSYEGEGALATMLPSFRPRHPKWPAFQKRATSNIYRKEIAGNPRLRVWIDATVTDIHQDEGRIRGLTAKSLDGHQLKIVAAHVAIAAGAIETTRLLLLLNSSTNGRTFPQTSPLGQGFHDHLSAPIGLLTTHGDVALTRLFSFQFVPGGMRNLRFELTHSARAKHNLPGAFLHVAFTRKTESGFDGLRRVYQALQRGGRPALADIYTILADMPWFLRAVWWRIFEQQVLPPSGADFALHLVTEQKPDPKNRITLSTTDHDYFGQPRARIDWRVQDEDLALFSKISDLATAEWRAGPLAALATPHPRPVESVASELSETGGIYHPAGTTRMGSNAADSVVDSRLRVHGVPGLWAVATSVFPTVGGTSPSLGLMQFAMRAAQDIADATKGNA